MCMHVRTSGNELNCQEVLANPGPRKLINFRQGKAEREKDRRQTDLPPWQQKIFSSMIAAMGRQLKQSVNVFHSFTLNLRLPTARNTKGQLSIKTTQK